MDSHPADILSLELQAFAQQLGLDALALDETGYCALGTDKNEVIHLQWHEEEPGEGYLELSVMVTSLSGNAAAEEYRLLLEMNFSGYGSGGGWFALRPGSDEVWCFCRVGLNRLTAGMLENALANCLQGLELWQEQLTRLNRLTTETPDAPPMKRV